MQRSAGIYIFVTELFIYTIYIYFIVDDSVYHTISIYKQELGNFYVNTYMNQNTLSATVL